jgi:hypothetical protein
VRLHLAVLVVIALVGALSVSCLGGSSHSAAVSAPRQPTVQLVVACDQVILQPRSPFSDGYRRVLGVISVPPAYIPQVVRITGGRWPYWEKSGLVVRAGRSPVTVSVPQGWRTRAAISWGNNKPMVSSLRFSACPTPANVWNAYAGGFFMRSHGACIPLVFQVGDRRQLVRFGIDRRCV